MPYPGYFNKIKNSDIFILYDTAQFVKARWDNRNRIRLKDGFTYITIPLEHKSSFKKRFIDIKLPKDTKWRKKHKIMLQRSYGRAEYFKDYFPLIEEIYNSEIDNLVDFNFSIIKFLIEKLEIKTKILRSSQMGLPSSLSSSKFLSEATKMAGGNYYLSGPSGGDYMDVKDFNKEKIVVKYQKYECSEYSQNFAGYVSNLSTVDLLFNQGPNSSKYI
tara:strand:- start:241 stop:891 length:651 start_codon:yes stop_codon:yes gene_type:complete